MNKLTHAVKQFWNDEEGVTAIEYSLIAAVIVVGLVAVLDPLSTAIKAVFTTITSQMP